MPAPVPALSWIDPASPREARRRALRPRLLPALATRIMSTGVAGFLLAVPARSDFPLEDYVPADFHRHHLSISPSLQGDVGDQEEEVPLDRSATDAASSRLGVEVNHGASRRSRARPWSLSSGAALSRSGYAEDRGQRRFLGSSSFLDRESDSEMDQTHVHGWAFTRLAARQYLGGSFFLSPSLGLDLEGTPYSWEGNRSWSLDAPLGATAGSDSAEYRFDEGVHRSNSLSARGVVRAAAGWGRIEDVSFAEMGLHMLDRLAEATGTRLRLSAEDMRSLEAHVEARRKTRPFLDARAAAIHDVESVEGFLRERLGTAALPARAVLLLADEWAQRGRHRRESGWEWTAYPFLSWRWEDGVSRTTRHAFRRRLPPDGGLSPDTLAPRGSDNPGSTLVRVRSRSFRGERTWGLATRLSGRRPWRRALQFDADLTLRWSSLRREEGSEGREDTAGGAFPSVSERSLAYAFPRLDAAYEARAAWHPHSRTSVALVYSAEAARDLDFTEAEAADPEEPLPVFPRQDAVRWAQTLRLDALWFLGHRLALTGVLAAGQSGVDSEGALPDGRYGSVLPVAERHQENWSLYGRVGLEYYVF